MNNMEQEEIEKTLKGIIVETLGCKESEIKNDTRTTDLGADSLDEVEMLIEMEKVFGVYISDEEASRVITFADAVELVERKMNE